MVVNNPLIRPYFLKGWALGGYPEIPMNLGIFDSKKRQVTIQVFIPLVLLKGPEMGMRKSKKSLNGATFCKKLVYYMEDHAIMLSG